MECPHCKSNDVILSSVNKHSQKRIYCKRCKNWSTKIGAPKILLFDIETSRTKVDVFRMGKQVLSWKSISDDEFIISWAAKWLFDPNSMSDTVTPKEAKNRDCKRITKSIYKLLDQADFIITHNGDRFDVKKLNWYFIKQGFPPNNRYKSIDTLKEYRKICAPHSAALDYLAQELGYDGKHHTDMDLWKACEAGNQDALDEMNSYNINDVFITEDIYLRIRGWMKTHPNLSIFFEMYQELEEGEYMCPRCMESIYKTKFSRVWISPAGYAYKSCSCPHCGAILRKTERKPGQLVKLK